MAVRPNQYRAIGVNAASLVPVTLGVTEIAVPFLSPNARRPARRFWNAETIIDKVSRRN
jgi:hypothetical protein